MPRSCGGGGGGGERHASFFKKQQVGQWGRQRNSRWEGHSGRDRLMLSRGVRWWRLGEQHEGAGVPVWMEVLVFPPILRRPPVFCWRELWRVSEDLNVILWTWKISMCICVTGCIHLCFSVPWSLLSPEDFCLVFYHTCIRFVFSSFGLTSICDLFYWVKYFLNIFF